MTLYVINNPTILANSSSPDIASRVGPGSGFAALKAVAQSYPGVPSANDSPYELDRTAYLPAETAFDQLKWLWNPQRLPSSDPSWPGYLTMDPDDSFGVDSFGVAAVFIINPKPQNAGPILKTNYALNQIINIDVPVFILPILDSTQIPSTEFQSGYFSPEEVGWGDTLWPVYNQDINQTQSSVLVAYSVQSKCVGGGEHWYDQGAKAPPTTPIPAPADVVLAHELAHVYDILFDYATVDAGLACPLTGQNNAIFGNSMVADPEHSFGENDYRSERWNALPPREMDLPDPKDSSNCTILDRYSTLCLQPGGFGELLSIQPDLSGQLNEQVTTQAIAILNGPGHSDTVTESCDWRSSAPHIASVGNVVGGTGDDKKGFIHTLMPDPTPVTITADYFGADATVTFTVVSSAPPPVMTGSTRTNVTGGCGCVIATVATDSPASDEVNRMRFFRDSVLRTCDVGFDFCAAIFDDYYKFSPTVCMWMIAAEPLRQTVRDALVVPAMIMWELAIEYLPGACGAESLLRLFKEKVAPYPSLDARWQSGNPGSVMAGGADAITRWLTEFAVERPPPLFVREDSMAGQVDAAFASPVIRWSMIEPVIMFWQLYDQATRPAATATSVAPFGERIEEWAGTIPLLPDWLDWTPEQQVAALADLERLLLTTETTRARFLSRLDDARRARRH